MRADRRKDMLKLIVAFRNSANASVKCNKSYFSGGRIFSEHVLRYLVHVTDDPDPLLRRQSH